MESKQICRDRVKKVRNSIPETIRKQKSESISQKLLHTLWYQETECFLVYSAIHSEADLSVFCENAWKDGKKLFFPKVTGKEMHFYQIPEKKCLKTGAFSIREPDIEQYHLPEYLEQTGVILVPGVAFDRAGRRIGYGGGYYDRFLEDNSKLYTVGVCFQEQLVEKIPVEQHDCSMRELIADAGYIRLIQE